MQLALYAPGLGYYSSGLQKFGEAGDFITAPEVSSLFSQCMARQFEQVLSEIEMADVLEFFEDGDQAERPTCPRSCNPCKLQNSSLYVNRIR